MELKLSTENIRTIALFEKVTKVHAKDCISTGNSIYFLVDSKKMGVAIGKNGSNIRELRRISGKQVKIFGYSPDMETFVRNVVPDLKTIERNGNSVMISVPGESKLTVIGKSGENINAIRDMLKRHFGVENFRLR